jgi:acyl-coenzyme A synthetase/AMP-(fatty) acid ligase
MNALTLLMEREIHSQALAFFALGSSPVDFGTLKAAACRAQKALGELGFDSGHSILLADAISAELYAVVMAALGLGGIVILVEPYLPVHELESHVSRIRPSVFVASLLGKAWGARVGAIRRIPHWTSVKRLCSEPGSGLELQVRDVSPDAPGFVSFTTGTTSGRSKGVIRTHRGLVAQNHALRTSAPLESIQGPDLAIFANLTLVNLGMGRGTIFVPPAWKGSHLDLLRDLPRTMAPESLSCGPAFLERMLREGYLPRTLRSVHVGGALTECALFERAFSALPEANFIHVYGSSEVEPVSYVDARESVRKSSGRGYVHSLLTGRLTSGLQGRSDGKTFWVSGDHVCEEYLGNETETRSSKMRDESGRLWHAMGDRMSEDSDGLWYQGRSFQKPEDFMLEQRIYPVLGHARAFVFRDAEGKVVLSGENLVKKRHDLLLRFPEISRIQDKKIVRDRRHRARIDREASR